MLLPDESAAGYDGVGVAGEGWRWQDAWAPLWLGIPPCRVVNQSTERSERELIVSRSFGSC